MQSEHSERNTDPFLRSDGIGPAGPVPTDEVCFRLQQKYGMPEHIRMHSRQVAHIATSIAEHAESIGFFTEHGRGDGKDVQEIRAAAFLHDLAKIHGVDWGGSHAQIGAAWALAETGNHRLAQAVLHHIWWPFELDPIKYFPGLAVLYADKRVRHDNIVSLGARFADLFERYGKSEESRKGIRQAMEQAMAVEHILSEVLKVGLNACTFDGGRLVQ